MPARRTTSPRPLHTAELLSIGSDLTVGETRDTNAGDLARELTGAGVLVARMQALPDDLETVSAAFSDALARSDLVVSTGGLGPTPDDLTREAVAAAVGETPVVDAELETWLRAMFERRGLPFPVTNLKQAWLIPSSTPIPNERGTAPGWWVDRPDGRVVVTLPGPPREMRPMWDGWVRPRLAERGLGQAAAVRVLRLTGIGESLIADRLGEAFLRSPNPVVATYARADAVDVRISAVAGVGRSADDLVSEAEAAVLERVGEHVWARGSTTWGGALAAELARLGWTLAVAEVATNGSVLALLGETLGPDRLTFSEALPSAPAGLSDVAALASRVRAAGGADVGLAVRVRPRRGDTAVSVAVAAAGWTHGERRLVFLDGALGRARAAVAAAHVLLLRLRATPDGG